jgi:hypothetical protein
MSLIRAKQPILTRVLPHQGNRRYIIGSRGAAAAPPVSGDPHFANVVALLHCNGAANSIAFPDVKGHTFVSDAGSSVAAQQPRVDVAFSKFGGGSARYPSAASNSTLEGWIRGTHADFALGSGDFCIEGWLAKALTTSKFSFFGLGNRNSVGGAHISAEGLGSDLYVTINGVFLTTIPLGPFALAANVFHHFALSRQGTAVRFWVNGAQGGATLTSGANLTQTALSIGYVEVNVANYALAIDGGGWLDDFRVTKGAARYTAPFVPPTAPFPDA